MNGFPIEDYLDILGDVYLDPQYFPINEEEEEEND